MSFFCQFWVEFKFPDEIKYDLKNVKERHLWLAGSHFSHFFLENKNKSIKTWGRLKESFYKKR